uniref:Integrase_H2C2 domain-containing protein n=1 Tax=Mesocestoides corti TaxID=53468 RepID=A0A5K3G0V1_MESCO
MPQSTGTAAAISLEQNTIAEDPFIGPVNDKQRTASPKLTDMEIAGSSQEARVLGFVWDNLSFPDGSLYYRYGPSCPLRVVVPRAAVDQVVSQTHLSLRHLGAATVEQAVGRRYWWPAMRDDINTFVQTVIDVGK